MHRAWSAHAASSFFSGIYIRKNGNETMSKSGDAMHICTCIVHSPCPPLYTQTGYRYMPLPFRYTHTHIHTPTTTHPYLLDKNCHAHSAHKMEVERAICVIPIFIEWKNAEEKCIRTILTLHFLLEGARANERACVCLAVFRILSVSHATPEYYL